MLSPDESVLSCARPSRRAHDDAEAEASAATGGVDRAEFMLPRVDDVS